MSMSPEILTAILAAVATVGVAVLTGRQVSRSGRVSAEMAVREAQRLDQKEYVERLAADLRDTRERLDKAEETESTVHRQMFGMQMRVAQLETLLIQIAVVVPADIRQSNPHLFGPPVLPPVG